MFKTLSSQKHIHNSVKLFLLGYWHVNLNVKEAGPNFRDAQLTGGKGQYSKVKFSLKQVPT